MSNLRPNALPVPSLWLRVVAVFIDSLIVVVISLTIEAILFGEGVQTYQSLAVVLGVMSIYQVLFLVTQSATLGKMAMRLSVVDMQGAAMRPDTAILRFLIYFVGGPILTLGFIVSLVMMLRDPLRRGLHDRIAGTMVIRGRPRVSDRDNRYSRL